MLPAALARFKQASMGLGEGKIEGPLGTAFRRRNTQRLAVFIEVVPARGEDVLTA